jgi:hypothetical protein
VDGEAVREAGRYRMALMKWGSPAEGMTASGGRPLPLIIQAEQIRKGGRPEGHVNFF